MSDESSSSSSSSEAYDELELNESKEDGKGYFWHNTIYFLTYKGWIDKAEIIKFILDQAENKINKSYVCHEIGDKSHNYEHTHVLVHLNVQVFGKSMTECIKCMLYMTKYDTQCEYMKAIAKSYITPNKKGKIKSWIERIQSQPSLTEAFKLASIPA